MDVVWRALFDIETLKRCIPGCKEVGQTSPASFAARGPLKRRSSGIQAA